MEWWQVSYLTCCIGFIIERYRILGTDTPSFSGLPSTALRAKLLRFLVNVFPLAVVRLQRSAVINRGYSGLESCRL